MTTNLVVLAISLVTNSQQQGFISVVGNKGMIVSQEIVVQQTDLGYIKKGKPIKLFEVNKGISSKMTTNAVPIAFLPALSPTNNPPSPPKAALSPTNATPPANNTNSPAYRHRLEREQRMKATTNAPPQQTK